MARNALLRVLRNDAPPPPTICKMLADLFDPNSVCGRQIGFRHRKGTLPIAARQIGQDIERTGSSELRKPIAYDLMQKYNLSEKQLYVYWKKYRDFKKV